jgi:hypothetical protein
LLGEGPAGVALRRLAAGLAAHAPALETELLPAAKSMVIRYAPAQLDPTRVLSQVQAAAAAAGIPFHAPEQTASGMERPGRLPGARPPLPPVEAEVVHALPYRLRLRLRRIRHFPQVLPYLQGRLEAQPGVRSVEGRPGGEFLIVHCDPAARAAANIPSRVQELLQDAVTQLPGAGAIPSGAAPPASGPPGWAPLGFPTLAVGLAALGSVPAEIVGAALALAALPMAARALEGARARRFRMAQADLATLSVLAAGGDFLTGGLVTWMAGLGETVQRLVNQRVRGAILDAEASLRVERAGRATRAGQVGEFVRRAPIENSRMQQQAETLGNRLGVPILALAGSVYLLTRDPLRATAVLKSLDAASGVHASAPLVVQRTMASALKEGVFLNGGRVLDQLARADTIYFDPAGDPVGAMASPALLRGLRARGVQPIMDPREGAAGSGIVVAVGDPRAASPLFRQADVRVAIRHGEDYLAGAADVLLLDGDPAGLLPAIDHARAAMRLLQQNVGVVVGPNVLGILAAALGVIGPAATAAVTNGTMSLALLNAMRPLAAQATLSPPGTARLLPSASTGGGVR